MQVPPWLISSGREAVDLRVGSSSLLGSEPVLRAAACVIKQKDERRRGGCSQGKPLVRKWPSGKFVHALFGIFYTHGKSQHG